jgi:hypothetical protein
MLKRTFNYIMTKAKYQSNSDLSTLFQLYGCVQDMYNGLVILKKNTKKPSCNRVIYFVNYSIYFIVILSFYMYLYSILTNNELPVKTSFLQVSCANEEEIKPVEDVENILDFVKKNYILISILGVVSIGVLLYLNFNSISEFIFKTPESIMLSPPLLLYESRAEVFPNELIWTMLETLFRSIGEDDTIELKNKMIKFFQDIGFNTADPIFKEMSCPQMRTTLGEILLLIYPTNRLPKVLDADFIIELQNASWDSFVEQTISYQKAHITSISNEGWWVGAAIRMQWDYFFNRSIN